MKLLILKTKLDAKTEMEPLSNSMKLFQKNAIFIDSAKIESSVTTSFSPKVGTY